MTCQKKKYLNKINQKGKQLQHEYRKYALHELYLTLNLMSKNFSVNISKCERGRNIITHFTKKIIYL